MDLESIQHELQKAGLGGWLFFDHHGRDPLAYRVLGLKAPGTVSRRWYYFIPDLNDVADLMWIEKELAKKRVDAKRKAALKKLQGKALAGTLKDDDLEGFRRRSAAQKTGIDGRDSGQTTFAA